ncbi:MAG TPA: TIGR00296 family protein [Thermoplasmata archaeon]|nr:TIGR00296 family protein [Thermoplasmata archaeon]
MDSGSVWVRAVPWARESLEAVLASGRRRSARADLPPEFEEKRGAFVTLKRHPSGALRGCIGYPLPILPLRLAVARAALAAATDDPRFPPVVSEELPRLTVEVSVLSVPEEIRAPRPEDRVAAVQVGRDGLIVEGLGTSGLLLPQVAPEQGWSAEEFLEGACQKAGLPFDAWRDPRLRVLRFGADVFAEKSPSGEVVRVPTGA